METEQRLLYLALLWPMLVAVAVASLLLQLAATAVQAVAETLAKPLDQQVAQEQPIRAVAVVVERQPQPRGPTQAEQAVQAS